MSGDTSGVIRDAFIRQRRNLLIISLVLLFAETAELKLQKLNVFGTELTIGNPVIVNFALWAAFVYWLWRYYVYFHDLGDIGYSSKQRVRLNFLVQRWTMRQFACDQAWRARLVDAVNRQIGLTDPKNEKLQFLFDASNDWEVSETMVLGRYSFREIAVQAKVVLFVTSDERRSPQRQGYSNFTIDRRTALLLNAKAAIHVLTNTHILSEYFFPFGIAALPLLYLAYLGLAAFLR